MSKIGTYEPPRSQTIGLEMPLADIQELVDLLKNGGFTVHPMDGLTGLEVIDFHAFYCEHGTGIVVVSICVMLDRSLPPFLTVHPCRSIFWRILWPNDAKLCRQVAAWLMQNGATQPAPHS